MRDAEYMALLQRIAGLERERLALEREQQELRDRMTIVQAKLALEIGTAKDQNGKPAYSNEQLRSAALTLALEAHETTTASFAKKAARLIIVRSASYSSITTSSLTRNACSWSNSAYHSKRKGRSIRISRGDHAPCRRASLVW